jgi:hypothetical protein
MDEYYKQIAGTILINPGVGTITTNANIFTGLRLSSKPCLLVGHEIVNLLYAKADGTPILELAHLSIFIQRGAPTAQIDDSITVGGATRPANLQWCFLNGDNNYMPVVRPVNLLLEPNQGMTISYSVFFKSPVALATDSFQFVYRLFWKELE